MAKWECAPPEPPYYAVVFTSQRNDNDPKGYAAMAEEIDVLASRQPGFLGVESARDAGGLGITVSYWTDREAIARWHQNARHRIAQQQGREKWYDDFRLRICRVEHEYGLLTPM